MPDSPAPQLGASDPISGLTGLRVHFFFPYLFPHQINILYPPLPPPPPPKKIAPLRVMSIDLACLDRLSTVSLCQN